MKIDETILCGFSSIFNRVIRLDKGIKRMGIIASWGNDGCLGCTQDEFNALAEFVVFNEGIKRPFYGILDSLLKGRVDKLFSNLRDIPLEKIHQLSYEEAFVFLQTIKPYVRKILDSYNCSSFVYNGILDAVNNNDCNKFVETLNKDDHSKFMKIMCVMKFILYGKRKPEKCNSRNNYWLYNHNLQDYFYDYNESEEISFIETTIQKYLGIRKKTVRTRKSPYTCNKFLFNENLLQQINDITYIAEGRYYNYWIDKFDKENISGTDLLGHINQKIQKHHQIEDCVSFLYNSILFKKNTRRNRGYLCAF